MTLQYIRNNVVIYLAHLDCTKRCLCANIHLKIVWRSDRFNQMKCKKLWTFCYIYYQYISQQLFDFNTLYCALFLQCNGQGMMWLLPCAPFALYNLSNGLLIALDTLLTITASLPTYLDRVAYGCLPHHSQLQWLLMALPHRHLIEAGSVMGSWTTPYGAVKWPIAENSFYWGRLSRSVELVELQWSDKHTSCGYFQQVSVL